MNPLELFYRQIASFQFSEYLEIVNIKKFRIALTKIRVSSHRLEIEMGRWARPERIEFYDRRCKLCNKLEDEFHFVLECPLYDDFRKQYIGQYYFRRPSMFEFIKLVSSKRKSQVKNLATFIFKAFIARNKYLYLRLNT